MSQPKENSQPAAELFAAAICLSDASRPIAGAPRLLSVGIHGLLIGLALIPWAAEKVLQPKLNETRVALYTPSDVLLTLPQSARSGGGGGGGKRELTLASRGQLPRGADKQLVPPTPEPSKNPDPTLIMEPTIVAPQLANLRPLSLLDIGDPNGVIGPPSSGKGNGGGIGNEGNGRGVGDKEGPGAGKGGPGGCCDGPFKIGGDVSQPTVVFRVEPEYSEEARKARYEGTVILEGIVKRDGRVDMIHLVRSLGFGLDQKAIDALKQWRFRPAMKNGTPVDAILNFEVRFNLR